MLSFRKNRDTGMRRRGDTERSSPRPRVTASPRLLLWPLLLAALCSLFTGCRRDMQDQPKSIAYRENTFYKDGTGSRPLVEGTVPRGYLREDRALYFGKKSGPAQTAGQPPANRQNPGPSTAATGTTTSAPNSTSPSAPSALYPDDVETFPFAITSKDLERGQERFNIFCSACHGVTGYGDGIVARRGFNKPAPANYHQDRLRQAPVGHFFDVMTNGWGAMPSYASQVPVEDRWRIIAYIRALQLSQTPPGGNPTVREGANQGTAK
jgi:mono/diheme cytochrome c family protein